MNGSVILRLLHVHYGRNGVSGRIGAGLLLLLLLAGYKSSGRKGENSDGLHY